MIESDHFRHSLDRPLLHVHCCRRVHCFPSIAYSNRGRHALVEFGLAMTLIMNVSSFDQSAYTLPPSRLHNDTVDSPFLALRVPECVNRYVPQDSRPWALPDQSVSFLPAFSCPWLVPFITSAHGLFRTIVLLMKVRLFRILSIHAL
jgi:hypothetical protein